MVINRAIRSIMREKKVTLKAMGECLGKKSPNGIASKLTSKNMTFDAAIDMLSVLGYEVVVQPRRPGARPKGQIVIDRSDKECVTDMQE